MKTLALITALALAPAAHAATVLLPGEIVTDPVLSAPVATIDYIEFFGDADISGFGIAVDGTPGELSFGMGFSLADPTFVFGGFAIDDVASTVLDGELTAVGFVGDTLEFRDGTTYSGSVTLSNIAAIPLPATLPLLAVALVGIAATRRK